MNKRKSKKRSFNGFNSISLSPSIKTYLIDAFILFLLLVAIISTIALASFTRDENLLEVADALTDILYVTYGAGHAFGIDLDKCFEEVQNSNMSKLGEDGKPIYNEAGKVMKGPNYFKPDLSKYLN